MVKLTRETIIAAALDLLDDVGIDSLRTRQLAQRLGVEQPALYWHFRNKAGLLSTMAEAAMAPHEMFPLPEPTDNWQLWFRENMRSFRHTLLLRRDGARLHAGTHPSKTALELLNRKIAFLITAGFSEHEARMGMLAASRYVVGSVLEEQAPAGDGSAVMTPADHTAAFEAGLTLIVEGLSCSLQKSTPTSA